MEGDINPQDQQAAQEAAERARAYFGETIGRALQNRPKELVPNEEISVYGNTLRLTNPRALGGGNTNTDTKTVYVIDDSFGVPIDFVIQP